MGPPCTPGLALAIIAIILIVFLVLLLIGSSLATSVFRSAQRITVCQQVTPDSVNSPGQNARAGRRRSANESCLGVEALIGPKRTQILKRGFGQLIEKYGRHEETRTPDLYRVKVAL